MHSTLSHLAIIMDGNGRWAKSHHLPRIAGHKKGADNAKNIIEACIKLNIRYLTLYTFSSENWNRPEDEVNDLMDLLRYYLTRELDKLNEQNVRLRFIGDRTILDNDIQEYVENAEKLTEDNTTLTLVIALSYGGRQELTSAIRHIASKLKNGEIEEGDIDESLISSHLYTHDIPDPDLLIRTGGEQRLSNFLLWQSAYTEFYFSSLPWPEFTPEAMQEAIDTFYQRDRRYGMLKESA